MRLRLLTVALLCLLVAVWGCAAPEEAEPIAEEPATTEVDREAVLALTGEFIAAYNSADVEALGSLYTADAVRMPPDQPSYYGTHLIRESFTNLFEQMDAEITLNVDEIVVVGDLAFGRGTFATTTTPKAGGPSQHQIGKWMNVVQRQEDGSWKISRDIWNSDAPVPAGS